MPVHDDYDQILMTSAQFPAGSLLDSYYDREVTRLSDRGMASNMIGDRWSDVCAEAANRWPGTTIQLPDGLEVAVVAVYRLDDIPRIATIASKRKLQNPDFIVVGQSDDQQVAFAVDAKFSIDTAKSSQVAADTLEALLQLHDDFPDLLPDIDPGISCLNGYFLSPDAPLTDWVLTRRHRRLSARVKATRVIRLPISPVGFLKPMEGARLIAPFAALDGYRAEIRTNVLLALYYFRLARACYGAWRDATNPILGNSSQPTFVAEEMERAVMEIARGARSAWEVVTTLDTRAEHVRRQRETALAAMPFPIHNKELRERVQLEAELRGVDAPSLNSVRKGLGGWYRSEFDERIGLVLPPVDDIEALIARIRDVARNIEPLVEDAFERALEAAFAKMESTSGPETA